jgi:hypothetical protein
VDIEKVEVSVHLPTIDSNNMEVNVKSQKLLVFVKKNEGVMPCELPKRLIKVIQLITLPLFWLSQSVKRSQAPLE